MFDKRSILFFLVLLAQGLYAQNFGDSFPVLKFDKDTVDFGIVNEGDTVIYDFWFTNVGNKDLVIKQAYPACGCTTPTHTKGPVKPGERGFVHVEFRSAGWGGQTVVKEVIIILGNGPENYARFKAKIVNKAFQQDLNQYKQNQQESGKSGKKKNRKQKRFKPLINESW